MSPLTADPLLGVARAVLYFIMAVIGIAVVVLAIAVPGVAIFSSHVTAQLIAHGAPKSALWLILVLLAAGAGILCLAFAFFLYLKRIVDTVGEGDPFIPDNAGRLARMGWIALAIQGLEIPMSVLAAILRTQLPEDATHVDIDFFLNGIVLALVLFVLARVFRKGTEMRADLEGTV
jgi:hypothetical protein